MYEFWYNYVKPKYGKNSKLCYMDTDNFIVHVKTDNIYKKKMLQKMLKKDWQLQIMRQTNFYLKEKIK